MGLKIWFRKGWQLKSKGFCSHHFEDRMFANTYRNRFVKDAMPTIFTTAGSGKSIYEKNLLQILSQNLKNVFVNDLF